MSTFFTINDDNIDEDEQSFAIVAEILDVSEDISCFQTAPRTIPCFGTRGATEIRITDNDREFTDIYRLDAEARCLRIIETRGAVEFGVHSVARPLSTCPEGFNFTYLDAELQRLNILNHRI